MDITQLALEEDIGTGDVSTNLLIDKNIYAQVICRDNAIICGIKYFNQCFNNINIDWQITNGQKVTSGTIICKLNGNNKEIITKERVALNFLQTLSSVATQTNLLVEKIKHTNTKILDTRKTIPGMRIMQKEAVICGGGINHRFGLYDAIILKENHISQIGLSSAVKLAKKTYPNLDIIIEVESLEQLLEADSLNIKRILCDNFNLLMLKKAVKIATKPLEASGNINKNNIVAIANTGIDFISIGSITKNIKVVDLSMLIIK